MTTYKIGEHTLYQDSGIYYLTKKIGDTSKNIEITHSLSQVATKLLTERSCIDKSDHFQYNINKALEAIVTRETIKVLTNRKRRLLASV